MKKLIHFTAEWCGPCRAMKPIIEKFIEENPDVEYERIDVDINLDKVSEYSILSVPTFVAECDNERIDLVKGAVPKARIEKMFENCK